MRLEDGPAPGHTNTTQRPRLRPAVTSKFGPLVLLTVGQLCAAGAEQPDQFGPAALKKLSLEELSQLEVTTVSKEPFPAFRTPAAVYIITAEDIRRSGATSIPDVLRLVPGVQVAQMDGGRWAVGIRGFQGRLSKAVRVLIDGRSVYTPLFAGVYWEVQHVLLEDVERIEVVRGPGATIWGANAVNGVINIITKSAKDTRGMLVSAASGNVEQGQLSWRYGAGTDRFSARVYGTGFTRGPQFHPDDRNFDDWRMAQAGFRADWASTDRDTITVQGDAYSTIAGQKLVISQYSPPAGPAVEDNGFYTGQNLLGVWRRKLAGGGDLQLNGFFDRTDRTDLNYREVRDTYDIDFIHHVPAGRNDIIWGAGARISPSEYIQTRETVDFLPHQQTYNIYSAFLQNEFAIQPDRLWLTLGSKFEHNTFSGFEFQPSVRLAWAPTIRQTLWGALTRAVRTPSRIEDGFRYTALLNPGLPLYVRLIGDGQFSPEQLIGYEFGFRSMIRKSGGVSLAAFHNRYDDLLSVENRPPAPETDPPPTRLVLPLYLRNGVRATTSGVEFTGLWDLNEWWRFRGSYSFMGLDARNKPTSNDLSTVGQLEGDSPAHKAVLQSMFQLPGAFEADLVWRYVSSIPNQRVPAYSTGDVRIGRRVGHNFDVSVVGRDLLQPSHVEYGGSPGPFVRIRRSAYVKLTWTR
jgi:iron complex outermembrane recepter protein